MLNDIPNISQPDGFTWALIPKVQTRVNFAGNDGITYFGIFYDWVKHNRESMEVGGADQSEKQVVAK